MAKRDKLQPLQIYQLLPRTNCKLCDMPGCMAFAMALMSRDKTLKDCPDLLSEAFYPSLEILKPYFPEETEVAETGLIVNREICNGCGDCVVICNKAMTGVYTGNRAVAFLPDDVAREMPPVLQIVDGVVVVLNWPSCKRCLEPPVHCRVCEDKCPFGALELVAKPNQ